MENQLINFLYDHKYKNKSPHLCKNKIEEFIISLLNILFPQMGQYQFESLEAIEKELKRNEEILKVILSCLKSEFDKDCPKGKKFINEFYNDLINIEHQLTSDAKFICNEDPAAHNLDEVIICYPGFFAIAVYRVAHYFYQKQIPLLPRVLTEFAHQKTGIDIHPGATIDSPFFIDHGTGIVIGETTHIGKRVKIFQGVTLGALSVKKDLRAKKRHPTIEDDCVVYANATILGGNTIIGKKSVIGGNVWITKSISENTNVISEQIIEIIKKD